MGKGWRSVLIVAAAMLLCASTPAPTPAPPDFVRGAYGKDGSGPGFGLMAATGFNSVMTGPYREQLDPLLARHLKAVIWLGNWLNVPTCGFERSDAVITSLVKAIRGHAAILAYYLGDEPHATECPSAPAMFKQRTELVHALDPGSKTFTVIEAFENGVAHGYARWAGTVDIIGFDVYPCKKGASSCDFAAIDSAVSAIDAAGISSYWAVLQDFQDCYYRLPTTGEVRTQFDHWARSRMSGYFVFSWNYQPSDHRCAGISLESLPDQMAELTYENSRAFAPSAHGIGQPPDGESPSVWPPVLVIWLAVLLLVLGVGAAAVIRFRPRN